MPIRRLVLFFVAIALTGLASAGPGGIGSDYEAALPLTFFWRQVLT